MGNFIEGYSDIILEKKTSQEYQTSLTRLASYDYQIYYIGNENSLSNYGLSYADRLTFKKYLDIVTPGTVNKDTMPVPWDEKDVTVFDSDANIVEVIKGRTYPSNMLIIVDATSTLSAREWETIRQCVIENNVPLLIFGADNVATFKSILLWSDTTEYVDNFFMRDFAHYKNNLFESLPNPNASSAEARTYVNSLVDEILNIWGPLPSSEA